MPLRNLVSSRPRRAIAVFTVISAVTAAGIAARPWESNGGDRNGIAVVAGANGVTVPTVIPSADPPTTDPPPTTVPSVASDSAGAPSTDPKAVYARRRPQPVGEPTSSTTTTQPAAPTTTSTAPERGTTTTSSPTPPRPPVSLRGSIVYSSDAEPRGLASAENIWVMDADGRNQRRLFNLSGISLYPDLSPDGRQVVWANFDRAHTPNGWNIVLGNADGSNVRVLVSPPGTAQVPKFSPDGKRILFRAAADGSHSVAAPTTFFTMATDGSDVRPVPGAADLRPRTADCAADGRHIMIDTGNAEAAEPGTLWLLNLDDGSRRPLGHGGGPSASPDGARMAYANQHEIWVADADGANAHAVTTNGHNCGDPSWSPDGGLIAFRCTDPGPTGNFDVWTVRPDGSGLRNVTASPGVEERSPTF